MDSLYNDTLETLLNFEKKVLEVLQLRKSLNTWSMSEMEIQLIQMSLTQLVEHGSKDLITLKSLSNELHEASDQMDLMEDIPESLYLEWNENSKLIKKLHSEAISLRALIHALLSSYRQ
ncbi:hypothetical protein HMI54_010333 [Coelomomyces lativittatus]|nr:hypothetical protein HMI54_010333 [Coelomomyces lativittatus]KAJ1504463.1 hypothetical protein HMI56_001619 [Coelomomyces lativittatus]KAJ1514066.1 hypothetical protein HMI55_004988 [Coelomomyces lativittatus]